MLAVFGRNSTSPIVYVAFLNTHVYTVHLCMLYFECFEYLV